MLLNGALLWTQRPPVITLMSTHPAISERIATLEAMAAALPAGKVWEPIAVVAAPVPEAAPEAEAEAAN